MASITVGAISLVVVQVLPLVSLQLSTQLIGASLDLLVEKKLSLAKLSAPARPPLVSHLPTSPHLLSLSPIQSRDVPKDVILIPILVNLIQPEQLALGTLRLWNSKDSTWALWSAFLMLPLYLAALHRML